MPVKENEQYGRWDLWQMLQEFYSVSDHSETLCIEGLKTFSEEFCGKCSEQQLFPFE